MLQRSPTVARLLLGVRVPGGVRQPYWDPTTLLLAQALGARPGLRVLEVGTGEAGVLATLAARKGARVVAFDVREAAVASARRVAAANGAEVEARASDLLAALRPGEAFDVVVFNPPYLPTAVGLDRGWDRARAPIWDGGERGDAVILRFLDDVAARLAARTRVLLGFGTEFVGLAGVRRALSERGLRVERVHTRAWTRSVVVEFRVTDARRR
ncbi:MAG: HemK2/MTQ2 family protein methyltransferase [Myxococcota bacterium]